MAVRLELATGAVLIVARFNALAAKNRATREEEKGRKKERGENRDGKVRTRREKSVFARLPLLGDSRRLGGEG